MILSLLVLKHTHARLLFVEPSEMSTSTLSVKVGARVFLYLDRGVWAGGPKYCMQHGTSLSFQG